MTGTHPGWRVITRKSLLLAGAAGMFLTGLCPPWKYTWIIDRSVTHENYERGGAAAAIGIALIETPAARAWLWSPGSTAPAQQIRQVHLGLGHSVDARRLIIEWAMIAVATGVLVYVLR